MVKFFCCLLIMFSMMSVSAQTVIPTSNARTKIHLFNGKNFDGWQGDENIWKVHRGVIVGGNSKSEIPQNEFLSTISPYQNYELEVKFKIRGYSGFINAGVQFHSERLARPANEMTGYQADIGEGCMGALYDESRRNKYLVQADQQKVRIKKKGWNQYRIVCKQNTITLSINDVVTLTYTETDPSIPSSGKIGLQIHGGGVLEVFYKDIFLTPLN